MSITGLPQNPLLAPLGRPATPPAGAGAGVVRQTPTSTDRAGVPAARPAAPAAAPSITSAPSTVPAEAPAGTDPALWSVLTTEERAFFAKSASLGPLTYGRIKDAIMPAPPAARGIRLDVRA
jgi:hypothetical protein